VGALAWVAPVALALVLASAAGAKLASPTRTLDSFVALGLPAPRLLAIAVPVAELATAVALVAAPRVGAALALAVLTGFSAFLSREMARGSNEPCACFGQVRPRPISRGDLTRNAVFMALAAVTLALPPT
jgi:uncharacterized membrane protein YphA (DoxX/SURF4 family)